MNKLTCLLLTATLSFILAPGAHAQGIGIGTHYWRTVDEISDEFDRDGFSWVFSFQGSIAPLVRYQLDLERFSGDFAGTTKSVYAPQALIIGGRVLYGGAGIGILYSDGDFANRPFYLLRAGVELPILPRIRLDLNANYHFLDIKGFGDSRVNTDALSFGAMLRLKL